VPFTAPTARPTIRTITPTASNTGAPRLVAATPPFRRDAARPWTPEANQPGRTAQCLWPAENLLGTRRWSVKPASLWASLSASRRKSISGRPSRSSMVACPRVSMRATIFPLLLSQIWATKAKTWSWGRVSSPCASASGKLGRPAQYFGSIAGKGQWSEGLGKNAPHPQSIEIVMFGGAFLAS